MCDGVYVYVADAFYVFDLTFYFACVCVCVCGGVVVRGWMLFRVDGRLLSATLVCCAGCWVVVLAAWAATTTYATYVPTTWLAAVCRGGRHGDDGRAMRRRVAFFVGAG